jgi:hypothetical protein
MATIVNQSTDPAFRQRIGIALMGERSQLSQV